MAQQSQKGEAVEVQGSSLPQPMDDIYIVIHTCSDIQGLACPINE